MHPPINKHQLSSFLGMVTYLSSYMGNISDLTSGLRCVFQKDASIQWTEVYAVAFQRIKDQISKDVTPRHFDTIKNVVLQVYASHVSVDAVLLQNNKPVAYASKALTPAKSRYSNIEEKC